ncbi:hypothetical protein PIB30_089698 [Stylosanthes scabra]|uniref:Uncharacterized protein n=1 Tax=Stylosanthes scabra TaxID=79078 RepID=A0ABU6QTH8_9FABA|nr:hypothetical protein [Stylosanthes scabra]
MASQSLRGSRSSRSTGSAQRRGLLCSHRVPPVLRVSGTKENPGRRFWDYVYYEEDCDFLCWADKEQLGEDPEKEKLRKKVISLKTHDEELIIKDCCEVGWLGLFCRWWMPLRLLVAELV